MLKRDFKSETAVNAFKACGLMPMAFDAITFPASMKTLENIDETQATLEINSEDWQEDSTVASTHTFSPPLISEARLESVSSPRALVELCELSLIDQNRYFTPKSLNSICQESMPLIGSYSSNLNRNSGTPLIQSLEKPENSHSPEPLIEFYDPFWDDHRQEASTSSTPLLPVLETVSDSPTPIPDSNYRRALHRNTINTLLWRTQKRIGPILKNAFEEKDEKVMSVFCDLQKCLFDVYEMVKEDDEERRKPIKLKSPRKTIRKGTRNYAEKPVYMLSTKASVNTLKAKEDLKRQQQDEKEKRASARLETKKRKHEETEAKQNLKKARLSAGATKKSVSS